MVRDEITARLAAILHVAAAVKTMALDQWQAIIAKDPEDNTDRETRKSAISGRETLFQYDTNNDTATVIAIASDQLTSAERKLIEWSIDTFSREGAPNAAGDKPVRENRRRYDRLRVWLLAELDRGSMHGEVPRELASELALNVRKIPLLVTADSTPLSKAAYADFLRVLEQYFGASVTLLPIAEREWLMLAPGDLIGSDKDEEIESVEDELDAIAMGLHEMLAADWDLETHVSIHYPVVPEQELVGAVRDLRETIAVGRAYRVGSNVHSPWQLRLERLLQAVPEAGKSAFLRYMLPAKSSVFDPETLATLETFFEQDCSVSDTAKQLYIHRNTLLYRLDKFKQETGLDVRTFRDAVLVRIAISLYKVTKRKL